MPFDGNNYSDPVPTRRASYHPVNPLVGPAIGNILRNAYVYSRMRSRGLGAIAYDRNLRFPEYTITLATRVGTDGVIATIFQDDFYCAAHWTHVACHVCFTVLDDADTARFSLDVQAVSGGNVNSVPQTLSLAPGGESRIPNGDTDFEGRGAAYEVLMQVPLYATPGNFGIAAQPGLTLPAIVRATLKGQATTTNNGVTSAGTMIMDSVSLWLESVG